jgi:hypothetical protein
MIKKHRRSVVRILMFAVLIPELSQCAIAGCFKLVVGTCNCNGTPGGCADVIPTDPAANYPFDPDAGCNKNGAECEGGECPCDIYVHPLRGSRMIPEAAAAGNSDYSVNTQIACYLVSSCGCEFGFCSPDQGTPVVWTCPSYLLAGGTCPPGNT